MSDPGPDPAEAELKACGCRECEAELQTLKTQKALADMTAERDALRLAIAREVDEFILDALPASSGQWRASLQAIRVRLRRLLEENPR